MEQQAHDNWASPLADLIQLLFLNASTLVCYFPF
jgi:hypothetical protein